MAESEASPPPPAPFFEGAVDAHYVFHSSATRLPHRLRAVAASSPSPSSSSSPARDWRLSLAARFHYSRDAAPRSLRELPARLLPFFAYKDVAVYVNHTADLGALFDAIYREWYPTRDRTVFNDGVLQGPGGPFFSSTVRVDVDQPAPPLPALFYLLIRWHVALFRHLNCELSRFDALDEGGPRMLVRPSLTQSELLALPARPKRVEYIPVLRPTFAECFLWAEGGWEKEGVRLVVWGEGMFRRIQSSGCEGLTRDVDLEERVREAAASPAADNGERHQVELGEPVGDDAEATMGHVSIWRGSLQHVMRAVLAGDEARKSGQRDFNAVLEEWLGN